MRTEPETVTAFTIFEVPTLDPILVVLQDFGGGKGRLVVECFGAAWSTYWGAMGYRSLRHFIVGCTSEYIANRMWDANVHKRTKANEKYLLKIIGAVQVAIATAKEEAV